jgi:putative transcriptional regulator
MPVVAHNKLAAAAMTSFQRLVLLLCVWLALLPACAGAADTDAPSLFLIAKPELQDPSFAQSVVLVVFPKDGAPVGVILNRPTRIALKEAFPEQPQLKDRNDTLFFGGPVQTNALMFLFRGQSKTDNTFPVIGDLFLSGDGELLNRLLSQKSTAVQRYFLGYSGWTGPQLEHEIALGAWYVIEADLETIVHADPKTLWRDLMRRATAVKT